MTDTKELPVCPEDNIAFSWSIFITSGDASARVTVATFKRDDGSVGVTACLKPINSGGNAVKTLDELAAALGVHHFNWYQICIQDPQPSADWLGNTTKAPYIDPPPMGYGQSNYGDPNVQWGDCRPWYFDETLPPTDADGNFLSGFDPSWQYIGCATYQEKGLHFEDEPTVYWKKGQPTQELRFRTWLVGVMEDGRLGRWLGGFAWASANDENGPRIGGLELITQPPTKAHYDDLVAACCYVWQYEAVPIYFRPNCPTPAKITEFKCPD